MPGISANLDASVREDRKAQFLSDATELFEIPGYVAEEFIVSFCNKISLEEIFGLLEENMTDEKFTSVTVGALASILSSSYGKLQLIRNLVHVERGFQAQLPSIRTLSCKAVQNLLDDKEIDLSTILQELRHSGIILSLIETLKDLDSEVASSASQSLLLLSQSSAGLSFCLENGKLLDLAMKGHSTARMRALSLIASVIGQVEQSAQVFQESNVVQWLVDELSQDSRDVLSLVGFVQITQEFAESLNGSRLLLLANIVPQLAGLIQSPETDSMVRSSALAVSGRLLLTKDLQDVPMEQSDLKKLIDAMDKYLQPSHGSSADSELVANALDAIGQLGRSKRGAEALLEHEPTVVRHLAQAVFGAGHHSTTRLVAIHSLASICGSNRSAADVLMSADSEEKLKHLFYSNAAMSPVGPSLSAATLALLKQPEEIRCSVYRLLSSLVARPWAVFEFCSKSTFLSAITDSSAETSEIAMKWRHGCCVAMATSAEALERKGASPVSQELKAELDSAVRRGPFLSSREHVTAIPIVATMERRM